MQLFIDTANVEEIRTAMGWGLLDGVTTNPSLIAREKRDYKETVKEICGIVPGPVKLSLPTMRVWSGRRVNGRRLRRMWW
jgi:transaldolase